MDLLPFIIREIADGRVEAVFCVRFFKVDLDPVIREHFGMDDFSVIVQRHEGIHHISRLLNFIGCFYPFSFSIAAFTRSRVVSRPIMQARSVPPPGVRCLPERAMPSG